MCGIVGIAAGAPVSSRRWLAAGRDALRHRGPDDQGEWWSTNGKVGFAHCRLAIIDLSRAGHQPMRDAAAELTIVFNGEIYNFKDLRRELTGAGHSFKSYSDTEVILASYREWGTDCLSHFNGMFSFAIYDARQRHVFLARDRAGEKPLFYSFENDELRFASELKGLTADPTFPRKIDRHALDCYLAMGYIPGQHCVLQSVRKLPPAHALLFNLTDKKRRIWRYWNLPESDGAREPDQVDADTLLVELERLLEEAVRCQLVADVPIGVLLSGGVDSSLVAAMAARAKPKIKTFTIRFPGHGAYDETEHARLIARHFGTEHLEMDASDASVDLLPLLAKQFDEPLADSSIVPTYLISRLTREHCAVVLGGDGGDELFGGYAHYSRLLGTLSKLDRMPKGLRKTIAKGAECLLPVGLKGRNWLQNLGIDSQSDLPMIGAHFDGRTRQRLMTGHNHWESVAEQIRQHCVPRSGDLLDRAARMDFKTYLPEDILAKVDRASMLNSLEVRAPLLDHRVIEFAFKQVPSYLKVTAKNRKILLKKLSTKIFPAEFDLNRKQGLSIPLSAWLMSGPWQDFFQTVLNDSSDSFFNKTTVSNLVAGQAKGRANAERLFALVMFELWRREYRAYL